MSRPEESVGHSRGPWIVEEGPHWLTVCRADASFTDGKREPIVGTRWSGTVTELERANVRLIASAPDLLAAVIQYVSDLRHPPQGDSVQRRIERAEAVLSKALCTTKDMNDGR